MMYLLMVGLYYHYIISIDYEFYFDIEIKKNILSHYDFSNFVFST